MQAILLLAHKGVDYIDNFCNQFLDINKFNIYIHQDIKNKLTIDELKYLYNKHKNIKKIISEIDCKYSDISIINAEMLLITEALKDNNKYLHLMSEQCYITVDENIFYDFFENNNTEYITAIEMLSTRDICKIPNSWRMINNKYHYYGGQWFSLSHDLLQEIIHDTRLPGYYNELLDYSNNPNNNSHRQSIDEVFFQNFIIEFGYTKKYNFQFNNDLRFVDWLARKRKGDTTHPGLIKVNEYYSEKQLKRIISSFYLIVRKIDYKNKDCIDQLNKIKQYYSSVDINMYKTKLVSICMCTRNRSTLMLPSIKSILKQTYKNIEFVIIDDNSTDNTEDIINQLYTNYNIIKYLKLNQHDFIEARNAAFRLATGDYIALIDSDDLCSPNKIAEQVKYLDEHPNIDIVGCKIKFGKKTSTLSIPKSTINWNNDFFQEDIKNENISMLLHFPSIMFRREVLNKFDNGIYFYPELVNGGEDQIFLYTLYMKGAKFGNCTSATYLYNYLEYDDSISATAGKHFDENNFVFKYIHGKPFETKMKIVNELYNKYNKRNED